MEFFPLKSTAEDGGFLSLAFKDERTGKPKVQPGMVAF